MPEVSDDAWIDLQSLIHSSTIKDGLVNLYYAYDSDGRYDESLRYKLRVALRAVGHKITKYKYAFDRNLKVVLFDVYTTITKEEDDRMTKLYKDWLEEVAGDDEYYSDSEETDSEEEDEEESSVEEQEEDNPT
jgi:hypothetical protein